MLCIHNRTPILSPEAEHLETDTCPVFGRHTFTYDAQGDGLCPCGSTDPFCLYAECNHLPEIASH